MTSPAFDANVHPVILPDLPLLAGTLGGWLVLGLKILAAAGFMAAADVVILYAS